MTAIEVKNQLLPILNKLFGEEYSKGRTLYTMRFRYGKYNIYKNEYDIALDRRNSTTLAKGLSKEEATGMMKLLEDQHE